MSEEMIPTPLETLSFIIRQLTNSATILSLICENAQKHGEDETFRGYCLETLDDQIKRIEEVIQICSNIRHGENTTLQKSTTRRTSGLSNGKLRILTSDGRVLLVNELFDRWHEGGHEYLRILADDERIYFLRREKDHQWEVERVYSHI